MRIVTSPLRLRYALSTDDCAMLEGRVIAPRGPLRAGRYVLFPVEETGMLIIHLGMTGSLRLESQPRARKHDHVALLFETSDGKSCWLVYNDPRRFGGLALLPSRSIAQARQHLRLGLEPTDPIQPETLLDLYNRSRPLKPLLMDNELVTGVGNIYASEICHLAMLSPHKPGCTLSLSEAKRLSSALFSVIASAIAHGGSTLRNYAHVDGSQGGAQQHHRVYGRAGHLCPRCGYKLAASHQAGRATAHCPNCQL